MENGGNTGNSNNSNNLSWENMWVLNNHHHHSRFDLGNSDGFYSTAETTNTAQSEGNAVHALLFPHSHNRSIYTGDGSKLLPDPHLMCLKLGKRHYFEDSTAIPMGELHVEERGGGFSTVKKGKPYCTFAGGRGGGVGPSSSASILMTSTATVPRCQVEGCHVALINAKDYHRRHKVCEMHSKSPKVVVLGLEQRFCQQCSRFHVVSEFDDSKRSCRRRLAGHNERRRKSSHDSFSRNSSQVNNLMSGRFPSPTGRALSLLSSPKAGSWLSPSDLSSRCSAALRELIAENRAAILARHLILDSRDWHLHNANDYHENPQTGFDSITSNHQHQMLTEQHNWDWYRETNYWDRYRENNTHVTLDLMQAPAELRLLSMRGETKDKEVEEEEEECSELWSSLEGELIRR